MSEDSRFMMSQTLTDRDTELCQGGTGTTPTGPVHTDTVDNIRDPPPLPQPLPPLPQLKDPQDREPSNVGLGLACRKSEMRVRIPSWRKLRLITRPFGKRLRRINQKGMSPYFPLENLIALSRTTTERKRSAL
ncbi:hypothetical protein EVAR_84766_1 [Eumeta japonica]|uniref:Uncharacterized protein n=1 Tax=Eumeta variegata TaxID=151549 RepID=A0A4C1U871_EUMVA|nr:hypothetical protein EVAR_84766_1 [Eumeta japonica]